MRIPENIRNTKEFDKARTIKHNLTDTKNKFKDKAKVTIKEFFRKKRHLSNEQKQKIHDAIYEDNQKNTIPTFKESPLVSIIIVNHNGASHLTRLLEVIDDTIHLNYEIIIVDNDSQDNSIQIIESYEKLSITLIRNKNN